MCLAEALLESVSLSVGPLNVVTRPRLWLKTTSEKGPHLSCVVFTLMSHTVSPRPELVIFFNSCAFKPFYCSGH